MEPEDGEPPPGYHLKNHLTQPPAAISFFSDVHAKDVQEDAHMEERESRSEAHPCPPSDLNVKSTDSLPQFVKNGTLAIGGGVSMKKKKLKKGGKKLLKIENMRLTRNLKSKSVADQWSLSSNEDSVINSKSDTPLNNSNPLGMPSSRSCEIMVDVSSPSKIPEVSNYIQEGIVEDVEDSDAENDVSKSAAITSVVHEPHDNMLQPVSVLKSYAQVTDQNPKKKVNFRTLQFDPSKADGVVEIPMASVIEASKRYSHTLYGYFIGKRLAFPVVQNYVMNTWKRHGLEKVMMNSKGFFFFKFSSDQGMQHVLEGGPWMIRKVPIILRRWSPNENLAKEDLSNVPVWIKLHDVPLLAFTDDGLSAIATQVGRPLMLDSYTSTMCMEAWGRPNFARAMVEVNSKMDLKEFVEVIVPNMDGNKITYKVIIEYEWKPTRCGNCKVFGHVDDQCPKRVVPNLKTQIPTNVGADLNHTDTQGFQPAHKKPFRGLVVGQPKKNVVVHPKQVYKPIPKKKTYEVSTTTTSNSFEALNTLDPKVGNKASSSEKLVKHKEARGKQVGSKASTIGSHNWSQSSLCAPRKEVYDSDTDNPYEYEDDDILDPLDDEMATFMSAHDRRARR